MPIQPIADIHEWMNNMREPAERTKKSRKKRLIVRIPNVSDDQDRLRAVVENFEDIRAFYQREVRRYSWMYIILTTITLTGTALTPLLLLLLDKNAPRATFWEALPSGVGGLAAALNVALRYRENWTQSYYTLSAVINEYQKFITRTSPDYSASKSLSEIIDALQSKMSTYVMSETESWRTIMLKTEPETNVRELPAVPSRLSFTSSQLLPGATGTGSITLTKAAPPGGLVVALSQTGKMRLDQKSLTVKGGATTSDFSFSIDKDALVGDKVCIKATTKDGETAADLSVVAEKPA